MAQKHVVIIGAGVGGLATAGLLARSGWRVTVFDKNEQAGGRAGQFQAQGFTFDTGPSWYLMPEVFERFFGLMDEQLSDHLQLTRLQPSFRAFFPNQPPLDIASQPAHDCAVFEAIEPGAGQQLASYLRHAEELYRIAHEHFLYKDYRSVKDFISPALLHSRSLALFTTMRQVAHKTFHDERLRQVMSYPSLFLGSNPRTTPAFYGLINHSLFQDGVWYPTGGLYQLTRVLEKLAHRHGADIILNTPVQKILVKQGRAVGVKVQSKSIAADHIISNADRHFTETRLLGAPHRDHAEKYWQQRTVAPSALLLYLGIDRRYPTLAHHNVVFGPQWQEQLDKLFSRHQSWPDNPSLYVCAPSRTDPRVAPPGHENLFVLVPVAAGFHYTPQQLTRYADKVLEFLAQTLSLANLPSHVVYRRLFCVKDFAARFHSFQGSALGLAHTLPQSAVFRPARVSQKVDHLSFVGADTHPGIGLPPALIAAELVWRQLG